MTKYITRPVVPRVVTAWKAKCIIDGDVPEELKEHAKSWTWDQAYGDEIAFYVSTTRHGRLIVTDTDYIVLTHFNEIEVWDHVSFHQEFEESHK